MNYETTISKEAALQKTKIDPTKRRQRPGCF